MYISTGDPRAEQQLESLLASFGNLPFFCINDTCDEASNDDLRLLRIGRTLNQLLPEPSSFEYVHEKSGLDVSQAVASSASKTRFSRLSFFGIPTTPGFIFSRK